MPSARSVHELLPWYATGTLETQEADEFRNHLDTCSSCREELASVQEIRKEIETHGEDFFREHPEPEQLVAALRGELDEKETAEIRRHLSICGACATEASWIRDEAVAESAAPQATPRKPWGWMAASAAAAAVLTALVMLPGGGDAPSGSTGVVSPELVVPAERSATTGTEILLRPGQPTIRLLFEIELRGSNFPVTLEVRSEGGDLVHRSGGHERESLLGETYMSFDCSRADCPPGSYEVRVLGEGKEPAELTFRFTVRTP